MSTHTAHAPLVDRSTFGFAHVKIDINVVKILSEAFNAIVVKVREIRKEAIPQDELTVTMDLAARDAGRRREWGTKQVKEGVTSYDRARYGSRRELQRGVMRAAAAEASGL